LRDVASQLRRLATPSQRVRFAAAHRAWLFGVAWQIGNRRRGHLPGLAEYLAMRLHSAGGGPTFALVEIAGGEEVPASEMDAPVVRAVTEMAIMVAALDNDRHSFSNEMRRGQTDQNVFTVLMRQRGCTLDEAGYAAVALRDRILCRFLRVREALLPRASGPLRRYLTGLGHGIRGNAEWGQRVPRYRGPGDPAEPTWATRPVADGTGPPPVPSIAWWWDDFD
jgi:hypothetical protein